MVGGRRKTFFHPARNDSQAAMLICHGWKKVNVQDSDDLLAADGIWSVGVDGGL